jgi:hypothetical protein
MPFFTTGSCDKVRRMWTASLVFYRVKDYKKRREAKI